MNKLINMAARGLRLLRHFIMLNLGIMLFAIGYLTLSAASLYAFYIAFGWWMVIFFALMIAMSWWLSRWAITNTLGE